LPYRTGNKAHDDALLAAESAYQQANAPGASQATLKAADLARARANLASCLTNNNGSGAAQSTVQLKELGVQT